MTLLRGRASVGVILLALVALAHGVYYENNVYSASGCGTSPVFQAQQLSGACIPQSVSNSLLIPFPAAAGGISSTTYTCGAPSTLSSCTDNTCSTGCGTTTPSLTCSAFGTGSANAACTSTAFGTTRGFFQSFYTDSACATPAVVTSFTAINTCIPATGGGYFFVYSNGVSPRIKRCTDSACTSCTDAYLPSTFNECLSFGSTGLFQSSVIIGASVSPTPTRTQVSATPAASATSSVSLTRAASGTPAASPAAVSTVCYFGENVNLPGNELLPTSSFSATTPLACCQLCTVRGGCNAWTHDAAADVCVLRSSMGNGPVANAGLTSGAGPSCGCVPTGVITDSTDSQSSSSSYVSPVSEQQALGLGLGLGLAGLICIIFTCLFLWFCLQRTKAKPTPQYGPQLLNTPVDWDYMYYDDSYYSGYSGYGGSAAGSQQSGSYNYYSYYSDDVIPGQGNARQAQAAPQQQQPAQQQPAQQAR